jgi:selenide,water dikinase
MSAEALAHVLRPLQDLFQAVDYPDLLVGLGVPDDAAVWRLDDERALVITTDFFAPIVDDPYDYGAIAAANALSDVYAMGAKPFLTLNIAGMPGSLSGEIVGEIIRGGAEKVKEAGAVVAGGHTVQDDEPKFGLVALGMCDYARMMTKDGAKVGDVLVITKPIGTGVTSTALKRGTSEKEDIQQAVLWMARLNGPAADIALEFGVRGATDVTGFSLLGHSIEMAEASGVALRFHLPTIPFLAGARRYAEGGNFPGGSADNRLYFGDRVRFANSIDEYNQMLLFDAQTSGGLLLAVDERKLTAFLERCQEESVHAWPIGKVEDGSGVTVLDQPMEGIIASIDRDSGLWFPPVHE